MRCDLLASVRAALNLAHPSVPFPTPMLTTYPYNHVGQNMKCLHIQITCKGFRLLVDVGTLNKLSVTFENTAYFTAGLQYTRTVESVACWGDAGFESWTLGPRHHWATTFPINQGSAGVGRWQIPEVEEISSYCPLKVMTPGRFRGIRPSDIANNFHAIKLMFKHPQIYDIIDICKHFR